MAQWNKNTVPKCEDKTCSDEVLVQLKNIAEEHIEEFLKPYIFRIIIAL